MGSSLRSALAAKRVREAVYPIQTADDTVARENLAEAKQRRLLAGVGKDSTTEQVAEAEKAVQVAQAAVDACYYQLRLRGISAADLEALINAHPPKPDAEDGSSWDEDGLMPALVAACTVDSDLSADEWADELSSERWTRGDRKALFLAAMSVCIKAGNDGLGKGYGTTSY